MGEEETIGKSHGCTLREPYATQCAIGGIPWAVLKALPRDAESEIGKSSGWDEA
ncbi:MAG: hypothetical protein EBE86_017535 [Hormoscilla sp. GUM202]|nr:hypothetical protein [Hormoscilla sp. GUM202]